MESWKEERDIARFGTARRRRGKTIEDRALPRTRESGTPDIYRYGGKWGGDAVLKDEDARRHVDQETSRQAR